MRRFFLGLLALGVLAVVSLIVLPSFVSSDWMRAELSRQLSSATGSSIALKGPVRLSVIPHLAVVAEDVSLDAQSDGVTAEIGEVAGSVTLSSLWSDRLHVKEVKLTRPVVVMRQKSENASSAEDGSGGNAEAKQNDPLAALVAFLERSAIDTISITEGTLRQENAAGTDEVASDLDLTLQAPDIDGELSLSAGARLEDQRYQLSLSVSPLRPLLERKPADLSLSVEADPLLAPGLTALKASGQVALNSNGSYQIRGGKLLVGEEELNLDALFVPGERPRFLADLSADQLDFSRFVESGAAGSSQPAGQSEKQLASVGLQALAGFDADVSVTVGAITVNDVSASDVALTATLKDGLLTTRLEHLSMDAGGISADITADVRKSEPTFKGRVASKGLDVSKLASLAGQTVSLSGTLAMDTGFAFRGLGGDAFRKTVNVSGNASLRDATFVAPGVTDPSMSEVKIKKLAVKIDDLTKPVLLAGNLVWRGKAVDADLRLPVRDLLSGSVPGELPLKLDLRMPEATLSLDGKAALAGSYSGKVNFASADLRGLLAWIGQGGGDSIAQFAFKGDANASASGVAFQKATLSVNGVEGTGNGSVELGTPLKISSALHFAELDLARLAGARPASPQTKGKATSPAPDSPLDLSSLRTIDASIKVDAEKLGYGRVFAGPVATTLVISEGVARLDLPESPFYGGRMAANLSADGTGEEASIALKASIAGASAAPLLIDLANFKHLEGALQAQFDITGAGTTTGALKRALEGSANVRFSDGAIRGIDVADVYNNLVGLMSSGFKQNENKATGFTELGASFAIENGVARTDDIKLIGPLVRMSGSGAANLPDDQLNFRLDPRVVASLEGQGADIATEGIGVPVIIEGSFAAPRIYPDLSGLLKNPDAALSALKKLGLPTGKLKLDELLSGGGKAGTIRDIIGGAIGEPPKEGGDQLSIEEIIGGNATEGSETPPAPPAEEQVVTPDVTTEQPAPEGPQPGQQPAAEAEQPAEESGTLGKLFNQLLQ
ncbi:AsmA family protein (plasmid) [Ensifer adhaerens]|uniref:AsmA family protein n=1 Tax=Ensifer adhaerens TaxID=106592 RepID=UPI0023A99654|nr:AsmA family protein [Ensifer adhaerens]WDZ79720.1 AsmA family protein [Ensifer adhaerens]